MKSKKSLLIMCLIICLFSIACVSAADDTAMTLEEDANSIGDLNEDLDASLVVDEEASTITQKEILTEETNEKEALSAAPDEILNEEASSEGLAASQGETLRADSADDGTFTALQKKIDDADDGAVITLYKDYTYDEGFSKRGIQIKKDITINGNGHTLNGLSQSRILLIKYGLIENNRVILNNIKFVNGNTNLYGGAIFNYGNLTVNNCHFTNNYAKYCGGAINSVGSLNLKNSKFIKNTAGGDAGAVFSLTIDKTVEFFKDFYKDSSPEGNMEFVSDMILYLSFKYGTDHMKNCVFTKNVAKGRGGGAIYGFTHLDIDSCTFTSNSAKDRGGAVFANKNLIIKNSKFTGNKAKKTGGAVYFRCHEQSGSYVNGNWVSKMKYYSASISNSVFTKNSAKKGGAVYGFLNTASDKKRLKVNSCIFEDNKASSGRDVLGGTCSKCVYNYIKLTSKSVTIKKYAKKLRLSVKLTKGKKLLKNKKVTFRFRGKNYKAKTNNKGIAKVIIKKSVLKKLKAGKKYTVKISYLKNSIKKYVKVKK